MSAVALGCAFGCDAGIDRSQIRGSTLPDASGGVGDAGAPDSGETDADAAAASARELTTVTGAATSLDVTERGICIADRTSGEVTYFDRATGSNRRVAMGISNLGAAFCVGDQVAWFSGPVADNSRCTWSVADISGASPQSTSLTPGDGNCSSRVGARFGQTMWLLTNTSLPSAVIWESGSPLTAAATFRTTGNAQLIAPRSAAVFVARGVDIERNDRVARTTSPFATNQGAIALAADATHVYWITGSGKLRRLDQTQGGGAPEDLLDVSSGTASMVTDERAIYWTNAMTGEVFAYPKAGATRALTRVAKNQATPTTIAIDDASLYWANADDRSIWIAAKP